MTKTPDTTEEKVSEVIEMSQIRGAKRRARRKAEKEAASDRKRRSNRGRISELERQYFLFLSQLREQFMMVDHVLTQVNERLLKVEACAELLARALVEGLDTLTDEERQAVQEFIDGGPAPEDVPNDDAGPSADVPEGE